MLKKFVFFYLIVLVSVFANAFSAPWHPRKNLQDSPASRNSPTKRGSGAYFGMRPQVNQQQTPFHTSEYAQPFDNQNPSTRGRGSTSTARVNTYVTPGEKLKEFEEHRFQYLIDQRKIASIQATTGYTRSQSYSFTLDPNPKFKPFILQSEWESRNDEEHQFKLWDPYSSGLFHRFEH